MYSYSYNMYIFQDAYRDEIIFMGTFKIGWGRIFGSAGLSGRIFNFAGYPRYLVIRQILYPLQPYKKYYCTTHLYYCTIYYCTTSMVLPPIAQN